MTVTDDDMETERGSQYRWLIALAAFGIPAAFVFSLTVVLVSVFTDQVLVSSKADLRRVEFGWPLVWVHQDQSSYDPPFPTQLSLASPWENPTSVSLGAVLMDVLFVFAVVSAAVLLAAALMIALVRRRVGSAERRDRADPAMSGHCYRRRILRSNSRTTATSPPPSPPPPQGSGALQPEQDLKRVGMPARAPSRLDEIKRFDLVRNSGPGDSVITGVVDQPRRRVVHRHARADPQGMFDERSAFRRSCGSWESRGSRLEDLLNARHSWVLGRS